MRFRFLKGGISGRICVYAISGKTGAFVRQLPMLFTENICRKIPKADVIQRYMKQLWGLYKQICGASFFARSNSAQITSIDIQFFGETFLRVPMLNAKLLNAVIAFFHITVHAFDLQSQKFGGSEIEDLGQRHLRLLESCVGHAAHGRQPQIPGWDSEVGGHGYFAV